MTQEQSNYIHKLRHSADQQLLQGNRALASRLYRVVKQLPHSVSGAVAAAIDGELDNFLILELKEKFSV